LFLTGTGTVITTGTGITDIMPLRTPDFRTFIAFSHDLIAAIAVWWLAYLFRFNFDIPAAYQAIAVETLPWVAVIQMVTFLGFGLYRGIWRYASLHDLGRILLAVLVAAATVPLVLFMLQIMVGVPRSVLILDPILLLLVMGGSRLAYRLWKERHLYGSMRPQGNPVLVLGAGVAAVGLIKQLNQSAEWRIGGLLDDNPKKHGMILHGFKVMGKINDLAVLAERLAIGHAIIAMPSATPQERRRVLEICSAAGVRALTIPSYDDLISGKITVSQIRKVELDDLLGREQVVLDSDGLHTLLTGETILVTGAGGSIGSELCRQIMRFNPGHLVLFELNEFALYTAEQEFLSAFPHIPMSFVIGDIKDGDRLEQIFSRFRPSVVFHAAAYKHVPLMEQENAWQAVLNNVMGTKILARVAVAHAVRKFVMVSTDKAVNPTNVMGASKRLAEMVCQAMQRPFAMQTDTARHSENSGQSEGTRFVIVRFGNVLGSTGSVIPKFREQIAKGGPVTVTHPEITRYFMSIPEAAQLVLQAGLMGGRNGGGEIFVLDMGEPVRIADLAKDMIRLSGLSEDSIKIEFTGLRAGEKLYEELLADDENTLPTPHPRLRIAQARQVDEAWLLALTEWMMDKPVRDDAEVKQALVKWVPEYSVR
jgi:FlaA1/EpsC-like NDP-sugar epimerase